jgi:ketosteroid isomerase-like protein
VREEQFAIQGLAEELTNTPFALGNWHSKLGGMVTHQLSARGLAAVTQAWQTVAAACEGPPTIRQLVLGAEDVLFPVPRVSPQAEDPKALAEQTMREHARWREEQHDG